MSESIHDKMKERVRLLVSNHQGIKKVELLCEALRLTNQTSVNFNKILEELVSEGEIVEVEYVLSNMDYRVKSIYFPKGTKLEVKNGS